MRALKPARGTDRHARNKPDCPLSGKHQGFRLGADDSSGAFNSFVAVSVGGHLRSGLRRRLHLRGCCGSAPWLAQTGDSGGQHCSTEHAFFVSTVLGFFPDGALFPRLCVCSVTHSIRVDRSRLARGSDCSPCPNSEHLPLNAAHRKHAAQSSRSSSMNDARQAVPRGHGSALHRR